METVQLRCGHCKKPIAIRVENLGAQVRCPHCRLVIQTPARADAPTPDADGVLEEDAPAPTLEMEAPPAAPDPGAAAPAAEPSKQADFTQFKKKPAFDRSILPLLALIFLVPYALLTTAFIAYLLINQGKSGHPLDFLRDPAPGKDKGAPRPASRQVAPSAPLAARHDALTRPGAPSI